MCIDDDDDDDDAEQCQPHWFYPKRATFDNMTPKIICAIDS